MNVLRAASIVGLALLTSCGSDGPLRYRSDVQPVLSVEDAKVGVAIPPFTDCRTTGAEEICTNVSIAGATVPGAAFADQASCDVVRTQRPYYPAAPAATTPEDDPRQDDAAFMTELAWARDQIRSSGCACCHATSATPAGASQWDIEAEGVWIDTLSDSGLALFAGYADSSVLGAYPADENHGFDRTALGIPTTDIERMRAFLATVLEQRGISEDDARAVPPFGGPIYDNSVREPTACGAGQGVDPDGAVWWTGGDARYVYVLEDGSKNPGVPPNLDRPEGTVWRVDVLASADPIAPGFSFGTTPDGSFQDTPATSPVAELAKGRTYQLYVLRDIGLPLTNCRFRYGDDVAEAVVEELGGLGDVCREATECGADADYCAIFPGSEEGYCTRTGCAEDAMVCPRTWDCFDLSAFQPGAPSFCLDPSQ